MNTDALSRAAAALEEAARALREAMASQTPPVASAAPPAPTYPQRPPPRGQPVLLPPFGKRAGQPIDSVDVADLKWYATAVQRSVEAPERAKYRPQNLELLAQIRAELAARGA